MTDLKDTLKTYTNTFPEDPKKGFGVKDCTAADKGGYGYMLITDVSGTANAAYVLAAKMETKGNANFNGDKWVDALKDTKIGTSYLTNANNKGWIANVDGEKDDGDILPENFYYVVTQ